MERIPNGYIEDDNIRELEGSRTWETGGLLNEGAVIKKMENGNSQLILTDEQIARMKALDEKYSVEKSKNLENEPLRDLSGEIEVFSNKERTKQILGGLDRFKNGLGVAIGVPALATFVGFGFIGGGAIFNQPDVMPAMLAATAIYSAIGSIFTSDSFKEMTNGVGMVLKAVKGEKHEPELPGYHNPNFYLCRNNIKYKVNHNISI